MYFFRVSRSLLEYISFLPSLIISSPSLLIVALYSPRNGTNIFLNFADSHINDDGDGDNLSSALNNPLYNARLPVSCMYKYIGVQNLGEKPTQDAI